MYAFTSYDEAVSWLYAQLPMFERHGADAYKPGLSRILAMAEAIGNPHLQFQVIHIAGTNGKGSVSHWLANSLQAAGYCTGLYTSPHIHRFSERIRIAGREISPQQVLSFMNENHNLAAMYQPSFFEWVTLMAFDAFARHAVDVAVVETGMGGRLDATNIVEPALSIITHIDYDHQQYLGNTLEQIAHEKAGIIKSDRPVLIGRRQPSIAHVFEQKARLLTAPLFWAEDYASCRAGTYTTDGWRHFYLSGVAGEQLNCLTPMAGDYQSENLVTTYAALHLLQVAGWKVHTSVLEQAASCSYFAPKARWQRLNPGLAVPVVADAAHNEEGIRQAIRQLLSMEALRYHIVLGLASDKSIERILALLPQKANVHYYWTSATQSPRALPAQTLARLAHEHGLWGEVYSCVHAAVQAACQQASPQDIVWVGGSHYLLAELPAEWFEIIPCV